MGLDEVGSSPLEESTESGYDLNTPLKTSGSEDNKSVFALMTPRTQMHVPEVDPACKHVLGFDTNTKGSLNESNKNGLNLITPEKNSRSESNKSVFDLVTPQKNLSYIGQRLMLPLVVTL